MIFAVYAHMSNPKYFMFNIKIKIIKIEILRYKHTLTNIHIINICDIIYVLIYIVMRTQIHIYIYIYMYKTIYKRVYTYITT